MNADETREMRTLRWRNSTLGKQLGRAGNTIHDLRCQLAESREINGRIARGELRDLQRTADRRLERVGELADANDRLAEQVIELREKLAASETVKPAATARLWSWPGAIW